MKHILLSFKNTTNTQMQASWYNVTKLLLFPCGGALCCTSQAEKTLYLPDPLPPRHPDKDDSFCWGNLCFQQPNCSASETGQPWFSFGPHLCKDKPHCKVQKLFFSLLSFCRQAANNNALAVQKAPEVKSSCALLLSDFYLGGNYHLHQSQVHSSDTVIIIIFWKMNIMKKHNNLVLLI